MLLMFAVSQFCMRRPVVALRKIVRQIIVAAEVVLRHRSFHLPARVGLPKGHAADRPRVAVEAVDFPPLQGVQADVPQVYPNDGLWA